MSTKYPKSPNEKTQNGMVYFPRMLDKIRLHASGELHEDYHKNLAREFALRDVRRRSQSAVATTHILSSSDSTSFVAVARGKDKSSKDVNVVGRGQTQNQADKEAFAQLSAAGAGAKEKIVYCYFSHGADSK